MTSVFRVSMLQENRFPEGRSASIRTRIRRMVHWLSDTIAEFLQKKWKKFLLRRKVAQRPFSFASVFETNSSLTIPTEGLTDAEYVGYFAQEKNTYPLGR